MLLTKNVTLLGNGHINLYAVGKNPMVILEGGISAVVPVVAEQIQNARWISKVNSLVIMHAHFDHVCGLPGLQKLFPHARLAGSGQAAKILQNPKIVANFFQEDAVATDYLLTDQSINNNFVVPEVDTIAVEQVIRDGEKWRLGAGVDLHFYAAPGHSPCSIMAYLPGDEVLFSSDAAGFPINNRKLFPIFFAGYDDYLNTIERMRELPVQILAGGHEAVICGPPQVRRFLDLAKDEAQRILDIVIKAKDGGMDADATAQMLFEKYYRDDLMIYSVQNIMLCCQILTRRALEYAAGA